MVQDILPFLPSIDALLFMACTHFEVLLTKSKELITYIASAVLTFTGDNIIVSRKF